MSTAPNNFKRIYRIWSITWSSTASPQTSPNQSFGPVITTHLVFLSLLREWTGLTTKNCLSFFTSVWSSRWWKISCLIWRSYVSCPMMKLISQILRLTTVCSTRYWRCLGKKKSLTSKSKSAINLSSCRKSGKRILKAQAFWSLRLRKQSVNRYQLPTVNFSSWSNFETNDWLETLSITLYVCCQNLKVHL